MMHVDGAPERRELPANLSTIREHRSEMAQPRHFRAGGLGKKVANISDPERSSVENVAPPTDAPTLPSDRHLAADHQGKRSAGNGPLQVHNPARTGPNTFDGSFDDFAPRSRAQGYTWDVLDCAPHEVAEMVRREEVGS